MSKRVLYICARYPHARGVKWVESFVDSGCAVRVLGGKSQRTGIWPSTYSEGGADVTILDSIDTKNPFSQRTFRDILTFTRQFRPDVVLVRDIFLAGYATRAARSLRAACYVDIADNYPEVLLSIGRLLPFRRFAKMALDMLERHVLEKSTGAIFVSPESQQYVLAKHGMTADLQSRSFVVENVPRGITPLHRSRRCFGNSIVYIGTFDQGIRDLDTAIRGLGAYRDEYGEPVELRVHAFEPETILNLIAKHRGAKEYVFVEAPIAHRDLMRVLRNYDVGLVPHARVPATEHTVPNKVYDYLFAGIHVLATDNPPLIRVLSQTGGGVTYECGDSRNFCQALHRARNEIENGTNPIQVDRLSQQFTWEAQSRVFLATALG